MEYDNITEERDLTLLKYSIKSSAAFERAERESLDVKVPNDTELFVDIDKEDDYKIFEARLSCLKNNTNLVKDVVKSPSMSGKPGRYHVTIFLHFALPVLERILLQACLASDSLRELLSYLRVKDDDPFPILFFERREK